MSILSKKILLLVALLTCLALAFAALFFWSGIFGGDEETLGGDSADIEKDMNTVYINGAPYVRRSGVENYLIVGIDSYGEIDDAGVAQADFITVVSFDRLKKTCSTVSINRDTMVTSAVYDAFDVKIGTKYQQIALSHATGSSRQLSNKLKCDNVSAAVSSILYGVKFDGYFALTMDAVIKAVDMMGGVPVLIEDDLSELDPRLVKGETVLLDGELAVRFLRARSGLDDSSNSARMKRQETFVKALIEKAGEIEMTENELFDGIDSVLPYMFTDLDAIGIECFADMLLSYDRESTASLPGESRVNGQHVEFYADEKGSIELVLKYFFDDYE